MANFTLHLDIKTLKIIDQRIDSNGNITFKVESTCTGSTCHKCGQLATKRHGHSYVMTFEHTSILDKRVTLEIKPVRYYCEHCNDGTTSTEKYDWVAGSQRRQGNSSFRRLHNAPVNSLYNSRCCKKNRHKL